MKYSVLVRGAFHSLKRNGRRTFLTMFGIIIGIAAVITIVSIGNGYQKEMEKAFKADGESVSLAFHFTPNNASGGLSVIEEAPFTQTDIDMIKMVKGVADAKVPDDTEEIESAKLTNRDKSVTASMNQVKAKGRDVIAGQPISQVDNAGRDKVVTLRENIAGELFDRPEQAIGQAIDLNGVTFQVIGLIPSGPEYPSGLNPTAEELAAVAQMDIPKATYEQVFGKGNQSGYGLTVTIQKDANAKLVGDKIKKLLQEKGSHRHKGTYNYIDMGDIMKQISQVLSGITVFISGVAGISLFIAGVGVMNMMYISVAERTKEIGVRRAMGATQKSIQLQFLSEGVIITLCGGVIGYLIGISLAVLITKMVGKALGGASASFDAQTILLAIGISTLIGIVFSVFPAQKAASKDIVEILR